MSAVLARRLALAAAEELRRLRAVRGAHRRTARRRHRALVALAAGLSLGVLPPTVEAGPSFFSGLAEYDADGADLADLDGDGDLDMVVRADEVQFVENTGSAVEPIFANPAYGVFGLENADLNDPLELVDIDGDGDSDLFGGNGDFSENTGSPTSPAFAVEVPFGLGVSNPSFVDLDADGDFDVLGAGPGDVIVFVENTGSATAPSFASGSTSPFGLVALPDRPSPEPVDIDGDGDADLFAGTEGKDLVFFENTGSATAPMFGPPTFQPFDLARPYYGAHLAFADVDGDGDFDAFLTEDSRPKKLIVNTGTPTFPEFALPTPEPDQFGFPYLTYGASPALADIDGDGDLDGFVGQYEGYTVQVHNAGTATNPKFGPGNPFGIGTEGSAYPANVAVVDIDGDSDLDLFVGGNSTGYIRFWENTGTSLQADFARVRESAFGLVGAPPYAAPTFGDIDGDGDLDALVGGDSSFAVFLNTGTPLAPAFGPLTEDPFGLQGIGPGGTDGPLPRLVDIDADGDLDLLAGRSELSLLENTGTSVAPSFAPPVDDPFGLILGFRPGTDFADVDGDGDLDAIIGDTYGDLSFAENTGAASAPAFAAPQAQALGLGHVFYYAGAALGDIDGDGDFDLFVGTKYGIVAFQENTGTSSTPAFSTGVHNLFLIPEVYDGYASPMLADIDGDGDFDVFVGDSDGETNFFENTGSATDPRLASPTLNPFGIATSPYRLHLSFVDVDGDGDLDLFLSDNDGVVFQENGGTALVPSFGAAQTAPFGLVTSGFGRVAAQLVDIDEDGDFDVLFGEQEARLFVAENTGTPALPAFAAPTENVFGVGDIGSNAVPFFADVDGDGDLDYFMGEYDGETFFFRNGFPASTTVVPFFDYKVKEADRTSPNGILPATCNVTVDDTLFDFGDGFSPENYRISLARTLGLPADREGAGTADLDGTHLLGLLMRGANKGALPVSGGKFSPARKHEKRTGVLVRILDDDLHDGSGSNTIRLDTKKETRFLLPTGQSVLGPPAAPGSDTNHYKCYKAVASRKGGRPGTLQDVKGKLIPNLQVVTEDQFADGQGHPFYGDGRRFDLVKVTEICNPVSVSNVDTVEQDALGATRTSTCAVEPTTSKSPHTSLLCFRTRIARLELEQPWDFSVLPVPIAPKQEKHRKRALPTGDAVHLTHDLEAPDLVRTTRETQVCFPARVVEKGTTKN